MGLFTHSVCIVGLGHEDKSLSNFPKYVNFVTVFVRLAISVLTSIYK